jgi:methylenetetrahydrofolate dehydrogenase (NADP+) / methenyltetrahydrofolate cyclohydrolase
LGNLIEGKKFAEKYKEEIKTYTLLRRAQGLRVPCIATILVGEDGGSVYYVNNQKKLCLELGIEQRILRLEEKITEKKLINYIEELNRDADVDGIMLQLPLPMHIDEKKVTSTLCYKKDVDGLTDVNTGKFYKGEKCFVPCTPAAVIALIKNIGMPLVGKRVVVLGRSNIVGKPVAQLLLNENATVTICHSKTQKLMEICKEADILVVAIGKPNFVTAEFIKEGAIVIDVGTSAVNGKITGDVMFHEVLEKASYVSPVPGGVGAVTTTMLMKNVCEALKEK